MFYDKFIVLCEKKGVAPTRAALDIGLSKSAPIKWRTTRATPNGETLNRISEYFSVPVGELLGEDTKKAPTQEGEREISDDDIMFALWGDSDDVGKDDLDDVKRYAAFVRERKRQK